MTDGATLAGCEWLRDVDLPLIDADGSANGVANGGNGANGVNGVNGHRRAPRY